LPFFLRFSVDTHVSGCALPSWCQDEHHGWSLGPKIFCLPLAGIACHGLIA